MNESERYHLDLMVRSTKSDGKKPFYLDGKYGKIVLHRKSQSKGATIQQIQDEIGLSNFRLYQDLAIDLQKAGLLDGLIDFYSKIYEQTNGRLGWSPRLIEIIKELSQKEK